MAAAITSRPGSRPSHAAYDGPAPRRLSLLPLSANPLPSIVSPVNEAGSFEFDRVLKSGQIMKRRKRTNAWDRVQLVLRPNLLSIYKDPEETILRHQINLSEVTAVAIRKDNKRRGDHDGVFGVFSPARNFHLEAETEIEARAWVSVIRKEARLDIQPEDRKLTSSSGVRAMSSSRPTYTDYAPAQSSRLRTSSVTSEGFLQSQSASQARDSEELPMPRFRPSFDTSDYSGNEFGSYSDRSETPGLGSARNLSLDSRIAGHGDSSLSGSVLQSTDRADFPDVSKGSRKDFYMMGTGTGEERTLWQGYLQCLKTNRGVRQWKKYWVVLRAKNLALYKSEDEYAAILIIPLSSVIDAVETDSVSKGKESCMQIITEDKSYRFACASEEDLSRWLGALKSTLERRKDAGQKGI